MVFLWFFYGFPRGTCLVYQSESCPAADQAMSAVQLVAAGSPPARDLCHVDPGGDPNRCDGLKHGKPWETMGKPRKTIGKSNKNTILYDFITILDGISSGFELVYDS